MEGTVGEVRLFAANFAPYTWSLCNGQIMNIQQNTALYAIIGTIYGGNGTSTFQLPNLMSRAVVGAGQGPGLTAYTPGETAGAENVTLLTSELPAHTHTAVVTPGTGAAANITLNSSSANGVTDPGGAYIGQDDGDGLTQYTSSNAHLVTMASGAIQINAVGGPQITSAALNPTGGSLPHSNIQPLLGLNYIICLYGTFPVRN